MKKWILRIGGSFEPIKKFLKNFLAFIQQNPAWCDFNPLKMPTPSKKWKIFRKILWKQNFLAIVTIGLEELFWVISSNLGSLLGKMNFKWRHFLTFQKLITLVFIWNIFLYRETCLIRMHEINLSTYLSTETR